MQRAISNRPSFIPIVIRALQPSSSITHSETLSGASVSWQELHQSHKVRCMCMKFRSMVCCIQLLEQHQSMSEEKKQDKPSVWPRRDGLRMVLTPFLQLTVFNKAPESSRVKFNLRLPHPRCLVLCLHLTEREKQMPQTHFNAFVLSEEMKYPLSDWSSSVEILKWYFKWETFSFPACSAEMMSWKCTYSFAQWECHCDSMRFNGRIFRKMWRFLGNLCEVIWGAMHSGLINHAWKI